MGCDNNNNNKNNIRISNLPKRRNFKGGDNTGIVVIVSYYIIRLY